MGYFEYLDKSARERKSIVCFGLDPDLNKIPAFGEANTEERIVKYFTQIIDASLSQERGVGAIKPNYAYFVQYGFEGLRALAALIGNYKEKLPIILDVKRGDIGRSSEAYAKEAFDFWNADAMTVSPYMGQDSVQPFLDRCKSGKGVYVLCRTSNSGAADFQTKALENGKPLYLEVARMLEKWHVNGIGAVLGATEPDELESAMWNFYDAGKPIAFLIPGVGTQGASAKNTARTLRTVWQETFTLHRINSSSAIAYAYVKENNEDFVGAALREIARLNAEIGDV
ncbi:MAG: orotidine-5'-phosphate decarboxylase [Candidatus Micrarchaeota archaeon]|nr:orotidine-5'-phosphate decarboxylase [Candidatus Micrarchaeota archaeon]